MGLGDRGVLCCVAQNFRPNLDPVDVLGCGAGAASFLLAPTPTPPAVVVDAPPPAPETLLAGGPRLSCLIWGTSACWA